MKNTLSWSMLSRCLFIGLLSLISFRGFAQEPNYPKDYFRNPLDIPILLAGNFGECRPNHFHSGIDIKTNGKENLAVHAAADGYVSRIKMEKGGFGHALYITHPNGYTTLYAHLNDFAPELQAYMEKTQYEKESWAVDIELKPKQFPVKKGEQIAWSGNTGASTAPHLHFEIRDTKTEHPLNPQLFGFDIKDTRAPVPTKLAMYDLVGTIYMQNPVIINLKKNGNFYTANDTVEVYQEAGFGINVNDFMEGSNNTLNFYTASWYMDDSLQGCIRLDDIGYDVTRYLHAYVDYPRRKETGDWYQLLFRLPGNQLLNIYPALNSYSGTFGFSNEYAHRIRIELKDVYGNAAIVNLICKAMSGKSYKYNCDGTAFSVGKRNKWDRPNISFELNENALYADICFSATNNKDDQSFSARYTIGEPNIPIHTYSDLKIKPNKLVPFALRDRVVMKYSDGKDDDGRAATFEDGWYKASVRNFGTYWLVADTTAPVIKPLQKEGADLSKAKNIRFSVVENLTSVKKFRAELDGEWLCFEPKGTSFTYKFDEHCKKGKHKLVVSAADENGNERKLVYNFTR